MRIWIDIENPPQVQYLMPLVPRLKGIGYEVLVTARDYGVTEGLLRGRGVAHVLIGREAAGGERWRKARAVLARAGALIHAVSRRGGADALLASSRSAAIAARILGIPGFAIIDYEFVELGLFRRTGMMIAHPDVIPSEAFTGHGWPRARLIPFPGLKEDISFSGWDPASTRPHGLPLVSGRRVILFRPPAERSHYFQDASRTLALEVLARLAGDEECVTIVSPRHAHQVADVRALVWRNPPVILQKPIPFDSLLTRVDLVVCAGGTMLREAAWLGVPAISIFQSRIGAVDRLLEAEGRIAHVSTPADFAAAAARMRARTEVRRVPGAADYLIREIRSRLPAKIAAP